MMLEANVPESRYLIQGSVSDWIISSSSSLSSTWLVKTIFTKISLRIAWILISDSYDDMPDKWSWYNVPQTRSPMGLELTCSLTLSEIHDSSQVPSLLGQKIRAAFIFLGQSSSRTFSSGHTPYYPSYDMHLTCNKRNVGIQDYLSSFHELLIQIRFSWIELAFDLCV